MKRRLFNRTSDDAETSKKGRTNTAASGVWFPP